jgi:hypothetical protein
VRKSALGIVGDVGASKFVRRQKREICTDGIHAPNPLRKDSLRSPRDLQLSLLAAFSCRGLIVWLPRGSTLPLNRR